MNTHIETLKTRIEPLRRKIIEHEVYTLIQNIDDLQLFMQYHVYAVWDFMSLLKTLQNKLTCTSVPWFPKGTANTRFLINEIVAGEESDLDSQGDRKSHYEMYLEAMQQCGADTSSIERFTEDLQISGDFNAAFALADTPPAARHFVNHTFEVIAGGKTHAQAATFTFGREDLIPNMFLAIVDDIHRRFPDSLSLFKYYLERHIEVDGGHHSHLALDMTAQLCGHNQLYWQEATAATVASLEQRILLWDAAQAQIEAKQQQVIVQG